MKEIEEIIDMATGREVTQDLFRPIKANKLEKFCRHDKTNLCPKILRKFCSYVTEPPFMVSP